MINERSSYSCSVDIAEAAAVLLAGDAVNEEENEDGEVNDAGENIGIADEDAGENAIVVEKEVEGEAAAAVDMEDDDDMIPIKRIFFLV